MAWARAKDNIIYMNYQVGDFIIRLKNASMARRRSLMVPYANLTGAIAKVLVKEGYLKEVKEEIKDGRKFFAIKLRYEDRNSIISDVSLFSKPSLRVYQKAKNMQKVQKRGLGIEIISTSKGIMSAKDAKKMGIGGELLFRIW